MAAEAAILGTPAIFVHSARLGYMLELEERYSLLWNTPDQRRAEELANTLLEDRAATRGTFEQRRENMLSERIDVAAWMIEEVRSALGR